MSDSRNLDSRARTPLAVTALATAALMIVVHLMAVAGYAPFGMIPVAVAFPIAVLCFGACIVDQRKPPPRSGVACQSQIIPLAFFQDWPSWAHFGFAFVFLYAMVNFFWFLHATSGGTIQMIDGHAVLAEHGRVIRALDPAGVAAIEAWRVRLLSGHILPFLVLPGFYFLFTGRASNDPATSLAP